MEMEIKSIMQLEVIVLKIHSLSFIHIFVLSNFNWHVKW